jgi:cyclohexa-1,5-dienecarbonyl-CoA hydratase
VALPLLPKLARRLDHEDRVLRLTLDAAPGNVLDTEMIGSLRRAVREARDLPALKLLVFTGAGPHFSYGASIEEHRPDRVGELLRAFHGFFLDLVDTDIPALALVRGQCLGGGLELAAACDWVLVEESARLGQPEIRLGVFAPAGSIVLPWRCGARAGDLLLTGGTVDAATARQIGLADQTAPSGQGEAVLDAWIRRDILPLSASSLRWARRAARWHLHRQLRHGLPELEALYLERLMATRDAVEGIDAFLEKRPPRWSDA